MPGNAPITELRLLHEVRQASITNLNLLHNIITNRHSGLNLLHELRGISVSSLHLTNSYRKDKKSGLNFKSKIIQQLLYRVFALNISTLIETELGTIDATILPLQLTDITLADAVYDLRFELEGYFWEKARVIKTMRVEISGGNVVAQKPNPIEDLTFSQQSKFIRIMWEWRKQFGTLVPDEFGIWIDTVSPDTGLDPDETIFADLEGSYSFVHDQSASTIFVAVASRKDGVNGDVLEIGPVIPNPVPPAPGP